MNILNSINRVSGLTGRGIVAAAVSAAMLAGVQSGRAAAILPDSGDAFVYEAFPTTNLKQWGFTSVIVLGKSSANGVTEHQLNGLIKFDLTGATLAADEKASLNLYIEPTSVGGIPAVSPSASGVATLDVAAAVGDWDANTVTWSTAPASGTLLSSSQIDHTGYWLSIDVTSIVRSWISGDIANSGLVLTQRDAVNSGGWVGLTFDGGAASANQPYLQISGVPEPASIGMAAVAGICLLARRRNG